MAEDKAEESGSMDVLGAKPLARAVEVTATAAANVVEGILERVCFPVAKEIGQLLKDRVHFWREANLIKFTKKLEEKMAANQTAGNAHAHPRIASVIIEKASWDDDSAVQEMWAGLLTSSCTAAGDDDSNLIFTDLLSSLTRLQARLLQFACQNASKYATPAGFIMAMEHVVPIQTLREVAGENDLHRLDRELDRLRYLGLLEPDSGFNPLTREHVDLTPSALALHMHVRCQGARKSPVEFFNIPVPQATTAASPTAPA